MYVCNALYWPSFFGFALWLISCSDLNDGPGGNTHLYICVCSFLCSSAKFVLTLSVPTKVAKGRKVIEQ